MHSIRFKISAITIVAIITTVVCVFLACLPTTQAENDRRSVEVMNLLAQDTRKSLEKYTESIEQSVEMTANLATDTLDSVVLAKDNVVGSAAANAERTAAQQKDLDAYLASYIKRIEQTLATDASHTQAIIAYYYCINPEVSADVHGFFYSKAGKSGFAEQEPLNASELDPNDIEHATWYYTPIEHGRPSWVGPYLSPLLDDTWTCSYLVPIYKAGALIGVLGMDIPVKTLIDQVSSIQVYDTGFACLLDSDGNVIYHPEYEYGSEVSVPVGEGVLEQEESGDALIRYTVNGQERQMSFTTLSNGMKLLVVAPTTEVNAATTQLVQTVIGVSALIIILFTIISMLLLNVLTEPLLRLTSASQRLATGDYDVELDYKGRDEVGVLTKAFQQMTGQLKANIEELDHRARTDDLTGLPNQRSFFEIAGSEKVRLLDEGKEPVLLYFNLLGIKFFNRQYGFVSGDRLIYETSQVIATCFGEDNTSRFSQDHFAVVTDVGRLEERLRKVFEGCRIINDGNSLPVSVGIYRHTIGDVNVSVACDRAKYACDLRRDTYESGFQYFDNSMLEQALLVRHIVNHVDQAIEERWVQVYYQPIVRASSGKVCDEEALSRWIDPERGFLSPGDFIPILEKAGLIYKLDLYVLDQVLEKMQHSREVGIPVVAHSINLSRSDFEACDMVEEICSRVDAAGIERSLITIELTESIIGKDFDFIKTQVKRFRALGFPVWIDDFGSGYSSLDFMQSIKFDLIKFDMGFLRKLGEGEKGRIILTKLMQMAAEIGVETICEGVEAEDQAHFLHSIGCTKLQGFYFGKPMPFSEILAQCQTGTHIGYEQTE